MTVSRYSSWSSAR